MSDKMKKPDGEGWKKYKGGFIREITDPETIRCALCDKSIDEVEMVMGVEGKNICMDCYESCNDIVYGQIKRKFKNGEIDDELMDQFRRHAERFNAVLDVMPVPSGMMTFREMQEAMTMKRREDEKRRNGGK
jgi:hypothetical protein